MGDTDSADFGVETIEGDEPAVIIAVHGQADLHTAPQLRYAMTEAIDGGASARDSTSARPRSSTR